MNRHVEFLRKKLVVVHTGTTSLTRAKLKSMGLGDFKYTYIDAVQSIPSSLGTAYEFYCRNPEMKIASNAVIRELLKETLRLHCETDFIRSLELTSRLMGRKPGELFAEVLEVYFGESVKEVSYTALLAIIQSKGIILK